MKTAAIILAAGSSSRMGQSKQTLLIGNEPLLLKSIHAFFDAGISNVAVVLGASEREHRDMIKDTPVDIVTNPQWMSGLGSSIKSGLKHAALKYPSVDAVVLSVCDQPLLSPTAISNLVSRHQETAKPIVASGYADVPGVPVLFHRSYFGRLANLRDDQGAKKIILQNLQDVSVVPFPGGEIDLDTMEDYQRFLDASGTNNP